MTEFEDQNVDFSVSVTKKAHSHFKKEDEKLEGPGQFLRHYSPNIESFLYNGEILNNQSQIEIENCVLIDFGGMFSSLKSKVKLYIDLSAKSCVLEAINHIFDALRVAETHDEAQFVLIADILFLKD